MKSIKKAFKSKAVLTVMLMLALSIGMLGMYRSGVSAEAMGTAQCIEAGLHKMEPWISTRNGGYCQWEGDKYYEYRIYACTVHCDNCGVTEYTGETYTEKWEATPPHSHSYTTTVSTGAWSKLNDTQHQRTVTKKCSCGDTTTTTEKGNHTLTTVNGDWTNLNTTQHQRTVTKTCSVCKGVITSTEKATHNWENVGAHRYGSATVCQYQQKCSDCDATRWVDESHSWGATSAFKTTGDAQHMSEHTCTKCFTTDIVTQQNHTFTEKYVGDTEGHALQKTCTVCGHVLQSEVMDHTYGAWTPINTSNGVRAENRTCSTCGFVDTRYELTGYSAGSEIATVMSDPMTLDEIKAAAGSGATSPAWKAAIGSSSTFNSSKAGQKGYDWDYNGRAYRLSERPDGLYYIVQLPTYYRTRLVVYNPNSGKSPGSGTTSYRSSTSSYSVTTNAEDVHMTGDGQIYNDPSNGNLYGQIEDAAVQLLVNRGSQYLSDGSFKPASLTADDKVTVGGKEYSQKTYDPSSDKYGYTTTKDKNGNEVKVALDANGMPVWAGTETVTYPVHHHSWATNYSSVSATQHKKIRTNCCGGSTTTVEAHSWGNWSYTDIGPEQHRAERVCKQCGYIDTKVEDHTDTNNDARCDKCTRLLWVDITWHWYDEHTPVITTTRQRYYRALITPPTRGRMDYKFTGWWTEWGGVGTEWSAGDDFPYASPDTLFASWAAIVHIEFDLSAPIITVTRDPADINEPTTSVTLTIEAVDAEGHDHELPLQLEGETEWHASPYTITLNRSRNIIIVARDTENNTRQFMVAVDNIDTQAPVIDALTSDTQGWTKDPITLSLTAHDDTKLASTPYMWEFTPNKTGETATGEWTSASTYRVTEAGKARVQVQDAVGNTTWSDYFMVNNLDTIAPELSEANPYTVDNTQVVPSDTGVTITLNISDTADPVTQLSSGLSSDPIKWQDEAVYGKSISKTVHSNGTYQIVLKDAVGNVSTQSITIDNISGDNPAISKFYAVSADGKTITGSASTGEWFQAPYLLVVEADFGVAGEGNEGKSYSWDGGRTWTSLNTFEVTTNGEYTVLIRDSVGTIVSQSILLDNTDGTKPTVGMYLYKQLPEDWDEERYGHEGTERDYVWKMRIDAEDLGSGIKSVYTQWDDKTYDASVLPIIFDVKEPGSYQVTVTDNAGNQTQAEKVVQWIDVGESVDGPNPNVPIVAPQPGTGGPAPDGTGSTTGSGLGPNGLDWGTAGYPYNANLEDLVFGPEGAYNVRTNTLTPYPADMKGIPVNFNANVTRNKWATAYVTFNGVKYPATWAPVPTPFNSNYSNGISPVLGTGDPLAGHALIPISAITGDMKNARITVTVSEWDDPSCTGTPSRVGTENFYTSAQMSKPTITYTYNQVTEELQIAATSAISGVDTIEYSLDGGSTWHPYDGTPVLLTGVPDDTVIVMKATDKLGLSNELSVSVRELGLNGTGGNLPVDANAAGLPDGTNSHHTSNRAADIYIIGGTRSNTNQVPNSNVFNYLTGADAARAGG